MMNTLDKAIKMCDAQEVHILFYRDIDSNVVVERFTDLGKLRSRVNELKQHGIAKIKEWTHVERAKEDYNKIFSKMKGQV